MILQVAEDVERDLSISMGMTLLHWQKPAVAETEIEPKITRLLYYAS